MQSASCAGGVVQCSLLSAADEGAPAVPVEYPGDWLRKRSYWWEGGGKRHVAEGGDEWLPARELWDRTHFQEEVSPNTWQPHSTLRFFDYAELARETEAASQPGGDANSLEHPLLLELLQCFARYGFFLLTNMPVREREVLRVPGLFGGFVRETNYGALFEVRVEERPSNLAYTPVGVQPHTDNPYRDPVPSVQLLHVLRNDCATGGLTQLVDGFHAAERLRSIDPEAFAMLSRQPMAFEYTGLGDVHLRHSQCMIQTEAAGTLRGVAFNNRSAAGPLAMPPEQVPAFYAAYRRFAQLLKVSSDGAENTLALQLKLQPGQCVVFDNTRVLHGRTGFSLNQGGGRWLQGCYSDKDAAFSKLRVLSRMAGLRR